MIRQRAAAGGSRLRRLAAAHAAVARLALNLGIAFLVANLLFALLGRFGSGDPITARYGREVVLAAYPGRAPDEVAALLAETWSRGYVYEPFTQFTERPFRGRYVNVSAAGFRLSGEEAPWPPDPAAVNVFVFGGSTLFGYGVADAETIPARLAPLLAAALPGRRVRCYNFGRGGYYSTQERILFAELLLAGKRPDLAVFVDGLNDFYLEAPMFTDRLARLFADRPAALFLRLCRHLPAVGVPLGWLAGRARRQLVAGAPLDPAFDRPAELAARVRRYRGNLRQIRALAEDAGVVPFFVVQPVPTYRYDLRYHPFARWGFDLNSRSGFGYPRLAEDLAAHPPGPDLLWLGDLQQGAAEPLYVDEVHYSPAMGRRIAAAIAAAIEGRRVLAPLHREARPAP